MNLAFQYSFSILKLEQRSGESKEVRRPIKELGVHNENIQNMHKILGVEEARQDKYKKVTQQIRH